MSHEWSTHGVEILADRVVKRFRSCTGGEHDREWRALTLLDRYAPDLAPAPLGAYLAADPPVVIMSRLPGEPLRGGVVQPAQIEAMARTLAGIFDAVPGPLARELPSRRHNLRQIEIATRSSARELPADVPCAIRDAVTEGLRWLDMTPFGPSCRADVPPVFGQGDGNLANFLWDSDRVRLVDFEDSGRSDRAYELADITEHVATWVDTDFDTSLFLGHFSLSMAEERRLSEYRRLFALHWLLFLACEDAERPRNPPGTAARQADRLQSLLG
jgi:Phosphotransferase enzyme family